MSHSFTLIPLMLNNPTKSILAWGLCALLPACLGSSVGTVGSGAGGNLGTGPGFDGVDAASAISNTSALISWPDAVGATPAATAGIKYQVFRSLELDSNGALLGGGQFIGETLPGITSLVDIDLAPFQTAYYRVEAIDTEGRITSSSKITSARTPSTYAAGQSSYQNDIVPLWETWDAFGAKQCISCHAGGSTFDLTSYEGLMTGTGTLQSPDSFVIPYDADATWGEFVFRFVSQPLVHGSYYGVASDIQAMRQPLSDWVMEGAIAVDDLTPPVFEFSAIQNAGKYFGNWLDHDTIEVSFFHASDPESAPLSGDTTGQLEYHIYAGETSGEIDWLNPVATVMSNDARFNSINTAQFDWNSDKVVVVIRALDSSGRAVVLPDPGDPSYMSTLALRWRNMSINEEEIRLSR